ncbi:MAG TPA: hypothetical protein VIM38_10055, partial [Alphaproteobacteria bacterium]
MDPEAFRDSAVIAAVTLAARLRRCGLLRRRRRRTLHGLRRLHRRTLHHRRGGGRRPFHGARLMLHFAPRRRRSRSRDLGLRS